MYMSGMSCVSINENTNAVYGINNIYRYIFSMGVSRNDHEKSLKYHCDETFFDYIDSEAKAYWLGFIYADGYITSGIKGKSLDSFGVTLKDTDGGHLEKLKSSIKATQKVAYYTSKYGYGYARLQINSEYMAHTLIEDGVLKQKSLILTFPSQSILPPELYNHFIRGYFDGDGSLKRKGKNIIGYDFCILGTFEFLTKVKEILGVDNKLVQTRNKVNNFQLCFGGNNKVLSQLNYLYKNASIYLDRKHARYIELQEIQNSRLRR